MQTKCQDLLQNGTFVDFRPAYDRIADLEHTYLEESVLAGIIIDADAEVGDKALGMQYLVTVLPTSAAFQHRSHRLIYACCLDLHSEGLKPTLQAVALRLASDGLLQDVGGRSKLAQLLDRDAFATLQLKQNAEFLREAYQRRRLAEGLNDINKEKDFDTALEKAQAEIERLLKMRSPDARLSNQSMRALIIEILERNLGEAEQRVALNNLALNSRWNPKEVRELVEIVESELDSEESRCSRSREIEQLQEYKGRTLTLSRHLPSSYANPMQKVAEWLGVPSAALLLELMVGTASSAHPETRLIVKESIGFVEPLIIYGGLVTESGQRKSPTVNAVFDAIKQLQAEEEERFRLDCQSYDKEQKEWMASCPANKDGAEFRAWEDSRPTPPPPLREFYLDIATVEAIDKLKSQQPDTAFVLLKDELSGLFGSYGAYKNGRGEDREAILSGWNGRGRKKNLKGGERVSTLYDAMSIFGAIQDSKLQQMMGSFDDDQGDWGRFLWALIPLKALRLPESDTTFQLAFLNSLFERIRALSPQKYRFAFDAQRLYEDFHWKLEQRRVAHPQRGMRAAIAKMEGYCARLALGLHLIWEVEAGRVPAPYIPRERIQQAIRLTEFFLSQVTLIHSEGAAALGEGGLTHRLSAILGKLKQFGELTARKLQASISWLRKVTPDKLRQDLMELAKLGYGTIQGKGNRLKLVQNQTADTADKTADKTADSSSSDEILDIREFQGKERPSVDTADIVADVVDGDSLPHSGRAFTSSLADQQHQHISSLPSNPELSSTLAVDEVSADISAVDNTAPGSFQDIAGHPNPPHTICDATPTSGVLAGEASPVKPPSQRGCQLLSGENVTPMQPQPAPAPAPVIAPQQPQQPETPAPTEAPALDGTERNVTTPALAPNHPQQSASAGGKTNSVAVTPDQPQQPTAPALLSTDNDGWLTEDCLQVMATVLENCPEKETLAELRSCWPEHSLNAACKLLKPETRERIMRWVLEQNAVANGSRLAPGTRVKVGNHYGTLATQTPNGKWLIVWDKMPPSQQKQYGSPPAGALAAERIEIILEAT